MPQKQHTLAHYHVKMSNLRQILMTERERISVSDDSEWAASICSGKSNILCFFALCKATKATGTARFVVSFQSSHVLQKSIKTEALFSQGI